MKHLTTKPLQELIGQISMGEYIVSDEENLVLKVPNKNIIIRLLPQNIEQFIVDSLQFLGELHESEVDLNNWVVLMNMNGKCMVTSLMSVWGRGYYHPDALWELYDISKEDISDLVKDDDIPLGTISPEELKLINH